MNEIWKQAVEDINNTLQLDPPFTMEDEESAIQEIAERQETDDAFVDEDYLPQNNSGLKTETVAWIMKNDIPVPERWEKRFKKFNKENEMSEETETTEVETKETKKAKKAEKAPKKEKVVKEKKAPKAKKEKRAVNAFGHGVGTIADQIDQLLVKGCTMDDAKAAGIKPMRFHVHFSTMKRKQADTVTVWKKDGKYFAACKADAPAEATETESEEE